MKIALKLAYTGWDFSGSQRQTNQRTVEGELLKALEFAKPENFKAAGRTDKGVSALGMVFSFDCNTFNISRLNHHLPQDMCCYALAEVPADFNPRFAKERHYRYFLPKGTVQGETTYSKESYPKELCPREPPDLQKMRAAAKLLEGTHDFSNFCRKSERSPIRTIKKINISKKHIDFFAESFLWEQVRRMSFFILQAGKNTKQTDFQASNNGQTDVPAFLNPFTPGNPIPPLPPENLILMDLKYPKLKFQTNQRILSDFKSRMEALAEKKRIEHQVCKAFTRRA